MNFPSSPLPACIRHCLILFSLLFLLNPPAWCADKSPQAAQALVKKAIAHMQKYGRDKALQDFNQPRGAFVDGELYIFVFATNGDGVLLANGGYPNLVGKNVLNSHDPDGVSPTREVLKIGNSAEGRGWVKYRWPHPVTHKIEHKQSYVERVGDLIIGAGVSVYK